jgi:hypothetical protein
VAIIRYPHAINNVTKIVYTKSDSINENVSLLMSNRGFEEALPCFTALNPSTVQTVRVLNLEQGNILFNIAN